MKIGVIGSGPAGQTLAAGLVKHGNEVAVGTGHPQKLCNWRKQNDKAQVMSFAEAAAFGEVIVLAVAGSVALEALQQVGAEILGEKIIVDATNPIGGGPPEKGVLSFFTSLKDSLMERLQKAYPKARFVKAFNSVGSAQWIDPVFAGGKPTMFICGNDTEAKEVVAELLEQLGWEAADMGAMQAARAIEPLCMLWCIPGLAKGDWSAHAFKLLK